MSFKLPTPKQKPIIWLFGGGVLLLLVAGGLWAYKGCTDPERVFWASFKQGLATSSVAVHARQLQSQDAYTDQKTQYAFGVTNMSRTLTTLAQPGIKVLNETVGTPSADYTRYLSISSDRKTASGKVMDFSHVLGVWAKGDPSAPGQLFTQAVFGNSLPLGGVVMPIGNLSHDQRSQLTKQTKADGVYGIDFKDVKKTTKDGRRQYTYKVTMQPVQYGKMLKAYAKAVGLHDLDQLDPNSLNGQSTFTVEVTIDVRSHRVVNVTGEGGVSQDYSAYDVPVAVSVPKDGDTIPFTELQKRLTQLQE